MPHLESQEQLAKASSLRILRRAGRVRSENALSQFRLPLLKNFEILFQVDGGRDDSRWIGFANRFSAGFANCIGITAALLYGNG
jgi:hypothetical protein